MNFYKKNIIAISFILANFSLSLFGWQGRVIPVAFNNSTNEWSILLGHDSNGYWSDFSQVASRGQKGDQVAEQALYSQTRGFYRPALQEAPWVKTPNDDILHVVSVPYKDARTLRAQASNTIKDDFAWIPYSEFSQYRDVSRPLTNGQRVNVSQGISAMIKAYMPSALAILDQQRRAQQQARPALTQPSAASWFNIPGAIYFYVKGKPYYEFTNFAEGFPFRLKGDYWLTSEQYYQAQKFIYHPNLYYAIRDTRSDAQSSAAKKAFDIAQANRASVDPQWASGSMRSLQVMEDALMAKTNQNPAFAKLLKSTGNAVLIEDSPVDPFFGIGKTGTGENHLGLLLMKIRKKL